MRLKLTLAALAATAAFASPAAAQVTSTDQAWARGTILQGFQISKYQDLDFGTVLASTALGSVTIDADNGNRTVSGGVAKVGINNGQRAIFNGAGPADDPVTLTLTQPASNRLYRDGTTWITGTLVLDSGGANRTMDSAGTYTVGVGGTFNIAANQPAGLYEATFDLTAVYQ